MRRKIITIALAALMAASAGISAKAEAIPIQRRPVTITHMSVPAVPASPSVKKTAYQNEKTISKAGSKTEKEERKDEKPISTSPLIEVGLIFGSELRLAGASDFNAKAGGKTIGKYKTGSVVVLTRKGSNVYVNGKKAGREVLFVPARNVPGFLVKGNKYRGDMKAIPSSWGNGITLINVLPMEDYLKGVVPSEIVPSWRMDAIKAQAVAARTYATYHRNGYRSSGYDVTDDARTQVYRGFSAETVATNRAVSETAGEVVTYAGKPIDALFHSSGGGFTENSENVWGSVIPYLRGVKEESSTYLMTPWKKTMTMASFTKSLENAGYKIGDLKSIKLSHLKKGEANHSSDRGISGRVKSVVFVGKKGRATVSGERLQRLYGLDSTLFDISAKGKELTITGYGYGHGLGLSQWGAEAMAEKHGDGKNYYKTILSHYFTGTKIEKIY